jgi:hypothetical protein
MSDLPVPPAVLIAATKDAEPANLQFHKRVPRTTPVSNPSLLAVKVETLPHKTTIGEQHNTNQVQNIAPLGTPALQAMEGKHTEREPRFHSKISSPISDSISALTAQPVNKTAEESSGAVSCLSRTPSSQPQPPLTLAESGALIQKIHSQLLLGPEERQKVKQKVKSYEFSKQHRTQNKHSPVKSPKQHLQRHEAPQVSSNTQTLPHKARLDDKQENSAANQAQEIPAPQRQSTELTSNHPSFHSRISSQDSDLQPAPTEQPVNKHAEESSEAVSDFSCMPLNQPQPTYTPLTLPESAHAQKLQPQLQQGLDERPLVKHKIKSFETWEKKRMSKYSKPQTRGSVPLIPVNVIASDHGRGGANELQEVPQDPEQIWPRRRIHSDAGTMQVRPSQHPSFSTDTLELPNSSGQAQSQTSQGVLQRIKGFEQWNEQQVKRRSSFSKPPKGHERHSHPPQKQKAALPFLQKQDNNPV